MKYTKANKLIIALFFSVIFLAQCKSKKSEDKEDKIYSGAEFAANIRSTEARTPEAERLGFKLPEGFEIQLYASEPDIEKPINISFDARGRMWVTQSFEYPFPAVPGKGKDHLTILEDTDDDGKADKFINFVDTLNIPIGVLPMNDGAIAYSIPNIYRFTDVNGDGKADSSKKLFGPFKIKDTHGMISNLLRGFDGYVHSCHGYTNRDTIAGTDGDSISMISGNTFRFAPDGSHVDHTTDGRINPFGLVYDEMGYMYSTDCHTSPLYQLIRGADYTQWGKEEGMGFGPDMTPLSNEATALAGIAYYADAHFPDSYKKNFYIGDVVRSRVYRYSYGFKGSTPIGKREEDFILSEDPWFRPVDVKMGPDGALYIADFYNSIIGHYEVPLDHPKRDHTRGRIWRVTYKGKHNKLNNLTAATVNELLQALGMDNMFIRMSAADQLADRIGSGAAAPLIETLNKKYISSRQYINALWALERVHGLTPDIIKKSAASEDPIIRLHTMKMLAEEKPDSSLLLPIVKTALRDKDEHVKRAATELLIKYPSIASVESALTVLRETPDYDNHLYYTGRLCLRTLLRNPPLMNQVVAMNWKEDDAAHLVDVMVGVPTVDAGIFMYNFIQKYNAPKAADRRVFQHIAQYVPYNKLDSTVAIAMRNSKPGSDSTDLLIFRGIQQGIAQRGEKENPQLIQWGKQLATNVLQKYPYSFRTPPSVLRLQTFAADVAGIYQMKERIPELKAFVQHASTKELYQGSDGLFDSLMNLKRFAMRSLLKMDPDNSPAIALQLLNDTSVDFHFKNAVGTVLGEFPGKIVNKVLGEVKNAPPDLQAAIAIALANTADGKDVLFSQVKKGVILPRTLMLPRVQERLLLNISPKQQKEYDAATAGLDPVDKERQTMIFDRLTAYDATKPKPTLDSGLKVFTQNCSPCHMIAGKGDVARTLGPQRQVSR